MRIATMKEIERYEAALIHAVKLSWELGQLAADSNVLLRHNANEGNLDGALAIGLVTANHIQTEWAKAAKEFKQAAYDMTGENPHPGENDREFITRLFDMEANDLHALSLRNGVVWRA